MMQRLWKRMKTPWGMTIAAALAVVLVGILVVAGGVPWTTVALVGGGLLLPAVGMATENSVLRESYLAQEDLTNDQYRFLVNTASGVRRPNSATEVVLGILQNAPDVGEAAQVMEIGRSKLQANAALGIGTHVSAEYVSATDAGKGQDAAGALQYARGIVIEAADAEDDLCSVLLAGPYPAINDSVAHVTVVTTDATAGARTYTAAEMVGGLILRDPAGASRSDVTPTAALLVAGIPGCIASSSFDCWIRNTADADETLTVTAGAGVTLSGTMTISKGNARRFVAVVTNAGAGVEAVTLYSDELLQWPWKGGNVASIADALAIPVTHRHVSKTTGADAEALTLANGVPGQRITITLTVDGGGTGTLTPATVTGFATIVFADAGDSACLEYVDGTVGWVLVGTTGVAAPPVITI